MTPPRVAAERLERAIAHTRGYAVIVIDAGGIIEQWNRGAAEIFGYSEDEALGMDAARLFTPEDIAAGVPQRELEEARRQGQASDRRWQQRKDGSRFFADGLSIAAYCDDGSIDGFVKILRDASSEKRAEDRVVQIQRLAEIAYSSRSVEMLLNDLMTQLCAIFACDTAAVLLLDATGTRVEIRAALGLDEDLRRRLTIDVGEGFAGAVAARKAPLIWNDPAPDRFVSPALRERELKAIMGVPLATDGTIVGVVHVGTAREHSFDDDDVNLLQLAADRIALAMENTRLFAAERAAAERASFLADASQVLGSSLDYEETLAEVARIAVPRLADWCAVDLLAEDGTLRRVAVQHVDPSKIALAHEIHARYAPRVDAPAGPYHVARAAEPELVPLVTDAMIRAGAEDEEHYRIASALQLHSYMAVPLCVRGEVSGVVSFVWAESRRTYTEDDLQLAQQIASRAALAIENARLYREANDATRARDAFLATVSHELRTPMTSILGWVEMLRQGSLDAGSRELALESIAQSARVQANLIEDLLDVSRSVAGKLRIERGPVDLSTVTASAIAAMQPQADAAGVRVMAHFPPSGEAIVDGDANRLQQVVANLLGNALKFTPRGGLVTARVEAGDGEVTVTITDTGRGIPPAILPWIFDPFRQADENDHDLGGIGLGLAIVRSLVARHDGVVEARSEGPGRGATFVVRLPRSS